jgi:hypothetical protein
MGNVATDTTTLAFTFTGTSTTRIWEIKVSQLTCSNPNRYVAGKLKYYISPQNRGKLRLSKNKILWREFPVYLKIENLKMINFSSKCHSLNLL